MCDGGEAEGKVALANGNRRGVRASASVVIHSLQAWPVVEDQGGPELSLHHPAPQAPCVPCCWLLTLTLI